MCGLGLVASDIPERKTNKKGVELVGRPECERNVGSGGGGQEMGGGMCVNMFAPHLWTRVSLTIDPCKRMQTCTHLFVAQQQ